MSLSVTCLVFVMTQRHQNILFPEGMFPKMKLMSGYTCPVCNHRRRVVSTGTNLSENHQFNDVR